MIHCRSARQIEAMRQAGRLVGEALRIVGRLIKPGVTTRELDDEVAAFIRRKKADALFLGYHGYPAHICTSVNEQVVHGIPGPRKLAEGEIVSVDVGIRLNGWCADAAMTFAVGETDPEVQRLLAVTREALNLAVKEVRPGAKLEAVCAAVQNHAEAHGFSVVRKYAGHGIGKKMHEEPHIPNFVSPEVVRDGTVLKPGMVLAIEPMVNMGTWETVTLDDGWTVVTADGKMSAHFEHTVAVTPDGYRVLTT